MNYHYLKRQITLCFALTCLTLHLGAENKPFFTSGIGLTGKGELMLSEKGLNRVDLFSKDGKTLIKSFTLNAPPTGIVCDGDKAYITTFETKGELHILNITTGAIEASIPVGSGANAPLLNADRTKVYVSNQFANTIDEVSIQDKKVLRTVSVLREPRETIISKDGKFLFATNFLPAQRADLDIVASDVSIIDLANFEKIKDIKLANGSNALRGMCLTPDGKYIYVSHNLGRFQVPTSQLQQGWMNTSAFSVIDVAKQQCLGAILVDEPDRGAAGIWDINCTADKLYISHSGTHEISVIDHRAMLEKFEKYENKDALNYDLNFLYGLRKRIPLEGNGPREMILVDNQLIVPTYFTDVLNFLDTNSLAVTGVALNPERVESAANKGEKIFNDASHCFQNWQSCNGCHPGDARTDGMNWDLMNDGVGNSKNCKSMLLSHRTGKSMITGIRASAEVAVRAGFKFIQFSEISEEQAVLVDDYLKSLKPVPSPLLVDGKLSPLAQKGRKVFEKFNCGECHSGVNFTDLKMHRIGERVEFEAGWDTPTLREVWRTAPYLFDGRAATLRDVFKVDKHGIDKKLSEKNLDALVEYVSSL